MAGRKTAKELQATGTALLVLGVGLLAIVMLMRTNPLAPLFATFRPLGWLCIAAGAFMLGLRRLRILPTARAMDMQVEPVLKPLPATPPAPSPTPSPPHAGDGFDAIWHARTRQVPKIDPPAKPTAWTLDVFEQIEWRRFEALCEALLQHEGYTTDAKPFGTDGGVDIWLYPDAQRKTLAGIVQCKNWAQKVGEVPLRELLGLRVAHKVDKAIFMAASRFNTAAVAFGKANGLELRDGQDILRRIHAYPDNVQQRLLQIATEGDYARPTCVRCGSKMNLRMGKTTGKPFWNCGRYPRCKHMMAARREEKPR